MNINYTIRKMNDLEITIQEVKTIYEGTLSELQERHSILLNTIPKSMLILTIDMDLLLERALLVERPFIKKLSEKLKTKLSILAELEDESKNATLKSEHVPQVAKVKSEITSTARYLFKEVFGDTHRYRLLDIDTIGENVYFGDE